jgi:hypothetical protein
VTEGAEVVSQPQAGWYPDPELHGIDRWWDGLRWTDGLRNTPENVKTAGDLSPAEGWYPDPGLQGIDRWWDRNRPG